LVLISRFYRGHKNCEQWTKDISAFCVKIKGVPTLWSQKMNTHYYLNVYGDIY